MTLQKLSKLSDYQIIIDKLQKNAFDKKYIHDVYRFLRIKDNDDSEYNRGWETALLEIMT